MRRPNGAAAAAKGEERGGQEKSPTAMPGGAAGAVAGETPRATPVNATAYPPMAAPERGRTAQRYMVVDGPRDRNQKIVYHSDGYVVSFLPGKEVSETTHDLRNMRAQGIKLEVIPDEVVEDDEPAPAAASDSPELDGVDSDSDSPADDTKE
jgi:hypothetical protein